MMQEEPLHTSKLALNRRGSTILSALIMGVVVAIMIFSSSIYMRSRVQAVAGSSNKMDNRIALDGMLAYTVNGIKQNWCFGETWTQDLSCDLKNVRNTARLIISDESLNYLGSSTTPRPPGALSATRLNQIIQKISLTSINANHPLYSIARPLGGKFDDVTFTIKRDDSAIATTKGREVRLKILVHLEATSGVPTDDLDLESQVVVYPRELSYFGLIVPGNLYLGSVPGAKGEVGLARVAVSPGAGLRFESPVFVNQGLHLPANSATAMNNVVFLDKVVLGGGMLRQGNNVYAPGNAGGEKNMYNHEMTSFSGLLGGYELDEGKDEGLEYLFGTAAAPPPLDLDNYNLCLKRIQASYDLSVTKHSQLYMRYGGYAGPNTFPVFANIGLIDNLIEQDVKTTAAYTINSSISGLSAGIVDSAEGGATFKVRVVYSGLKPSGAHPRGTYTNEFYLSRTGRVTLSPMGIANAARLIITSQPHRTGGNEQFNQTDMVVSFESPGSLDLSPFSQSGLPVQDSIKIFFEAHDYAYSEGRNLRNPTNDLVTDTQLGIYKNNGLTFNRVAGAMEIAQTSTAWSTNEVLNDDITGLFKIWDPQQAPKEIDLASLDEACMAAPDTTANSAFYASFPSANWGTSFAKQAVHAWQFSTEYPNGKFEGTVAFDSNANRLDVAASKFPSFGIRSVIRDCVIESTANFVAGFYVCDTLTIRPRSEPLRIIGTFITGKVTIDDSAYRAGIRWSSIYHPQAVYELRLARILGKYKNGTFANCDVSALPPLWSPNLGIHSALAHYLCNPVSLRTADPFKWTMVDPDCGIDAAVSPDKVACKSQPRRFLIKEISRTKGM